jgi:Outer membrane protein beta-barrel domain
MNENLHDIDKLFHDSIEGHEELPSENVWDNLDHTLDKGTNLVAQKKYNKLKRLSIVLLLLLLGSIAFQLYTGKSHEGLTVKNKTEETEGINKDAGLPGKPAIQKDNDKTVMPANTKNSVATAIPGKTISNKIVDNSPVPAETENAVAEKTPGAGIPAKPVIANDSHHSINTVPPVTVINKKAPLNNNVSNSTNIKTKDKNSKPDAASSLVRITKPAHKDNFPPHDYSENNIAITHIRNSEHKNKWLEKTTGQLNPDQSNTEIPAIAAGKINSKGEKASKRTITAGNKETPVATVADAKSLKAALVEKTGQDALFNFHARVQINEERSKPGIELNTGTAKISVIKKPRPFHFTVMPFFSPQISFNRIENDDNPVRVGPGGGPLHDDRSIIKKDETHQTSYSWGVLVEIPVRKKWSVQSGFNYINRSITIEPKKIFAQLDNDGKVKYRFDCSSGYTYLSPKAGTTAPAVGDSITTGGSSTNLQYLGIPLIVNYTFLKGKFNIIPSAGAMVNFLVKEKIQTSLPSGASNEKQDISSINGLKKTYFNAVAGLGLQYNAGKRIAVNITPAFNFALNSINQDAAVKSYPNSFGITGGIKIQF